MIEYKSSVYSFEELKDATWYCKFTLEAIENTNKEDEFMDYLRICFNDCDTLPTLTEINDFIRFDTNQIFEAMGLNEDGEEI